MARTAVFLNPGARLSESLEIAGRADSLGYESIWVTHGLGRDALLTLSAYSRVAPRVGLGTGVIPIYPRHPVLLAQEALTLSDITGGRLRLGIGVSHRPMMEGALGLDMGRPLDLMREYVSVLSAALGGKVDHRGPRYRATWQSGLPALPPAPPILLAGLGAKMLELAGEIADGVVLWLCAPAYIRDKAIPAIKRGRQRAGKSLEGFEIVAAVPAALTVDKPAGTALFKAELMRYLALPFYRAMLEASGFAADLAAFDHAPRPDAVSDRLAAALGAVGDFKTLSAFVTAHREAGVTLPAIRPIGFPDAAHYVPTVEAAIAT
ncbi:MAG TPA: LLM class flavin-dependent oxidoreductase [Methylomirabilota bacterium]|jgi:alkanesulfonate monooxygenase SsuD/methylene tetrahydromethanopterin reductase-like flavin-dependent oxidoreductase (luciferase family)|nr:LLM class flavin-dependent oxidoreductase [Methylomirabilota bacterium]